MDIENVLRSIYYDQKHTAGLGTATKLYNAAKELLPNIKLNNVKDWLQGEFTYTLHKPARKYIKRNPIIAEEPNQQIEADLVDMQEFKRFNKGYNYILTVIDVMTKYAKVVPLINKTSHSIVNAFKIIFKNGIIPKYLRTDKG